METQSVVGAFASLRRDECVQLGDELRSGSLDERPPSGWSCRAKWNPTAVRFAGSRSVTGVTAPFGERERSTRRDELRWVTLGRCVSDFGQVTLVETAGPAVGRRVETRDVVAVSATFGAREPTNSTHRVAVCGTPERSEFP